MKALQVPYAFNGDSQIVSAAQANKEADYFCPACHSKLILRKGQVKIAHFAHRVDLNCNQETILHKTAKALIGKAVKDWKGGLITAPLIKRICACCSEPMMQPLPTKVEYSLEEYRIENWIADVMLMGTEAPLAAIEIRVTHQVDERKQAYFPLPLIELDGQGVIRDPYRWFPLLDMFKPSLCQKCRVTLESISLIALKSNLEFDENVYIPAATTCYRCHKQILVFKWSSSSYGRDQPSEPKPRTIEYRFSKTVGKEYWANTCPYCNALLGNHFIYGDSEIVNQWNYQAARKSNSVG